MGWRNEFTNTAVLGLGHPASLPVTPSFSTPRLAMYPKASISKILPLRTLNLCAASRSKRPRGPAAR